MKLCYGYLIANLWACENQTYPGYVTEKPLQAYLAGAVLILYYSPSEGVNSSEINKKAMIYAGDFTSEDDRVEYIKKIDQDNQLYCDIWNQKFTINPDRNYEAIKNRLWSKLDEIFKAKLKGKF